jgi:hypothetical protein
MKIKTRPDDVSMVQMNDWLAELRDEDRAEPASDDATRPEAPAAAAPNGPAAGPETGAPAQVSEPAAAEIAARAGTPAEAGSRASASVRAVIGDQIRMPIMWCEMGSCISWYTHLAALGEADTRARAIAAGWRVDALGRLTCPDCQQTDPRFWATCTVVPWDRYTAIMRTARITAVRRDGTCGSAVPEVSHDRGRAASRDLRPTANGHLGASGHLATTPAESVWLRNYAAARTM